MFDRRTRSPRERHFCDDAPRCRARHVENAKKRGGDRESCARPESVGCCIAKSPKATEKVHRTIGRKCIEQRRRTIEIRVHVVSNVRRQRRSGVVSKGKYNVNSRFPSSLISRHFSTGSRRLSHLLSIHRLGLMGGTGCTAVRAISQDRPRFSRKSGRWV